MVLCCEKLKTDSSVTTCPWRDNLSSAGTGQWMLINVELSCVETFVVSAKLADTTAPDDGI